MGQVDENETLSNAMVVWIGKGYGSTPRRSDDRLREEFGEEKAASLLPRLRELMGDFYKTDAKDAGNMGAMSIKAKADFRPKHPEISEEAVSALAWIYVWNMK